MTRTFSVIFIHFRFLFGVRPVLNRNQKFEEDDNRYVNMQYINIATSNVKGIVLTLFLNRIFINDSFHFFLFLSWVVLNIAVSHMHLTVLLWLWGSCHISGFLARNWTNSMANENYSLFFFYCVYFSLSFVQSYLVHYTFLKSFFSSNSHVLPKKAGNLGAKTRADTTLLHSVVREKEKKERRKCLQCTLICPKITSAFNMQTSEFNSPFIPQHLLSQPQQCSPGIDQLIQNAGEKFFKIFIKNLSDCRACKQCVSRIKITP